VRGKETPQHVLYGGDILRRRTTHRPTNDQLGILQCSAVEVITRECDLRAPRVVACTNAHHLIIIIPRLTSPSSLIVHTHTYTRPFDGPLSGTTRVSRYQKGKPICILLEQETVSGSGISWAICKSAPRSRQTTTPAPHHSVFTGPGQVVHTRASVATKHITWYRSGGGDALRLGRSP